MDIQREISSVDVAAAARRISGRVRRVTLLPADNFDQAEVTFATEFMQYTGTFKARGAINLSAFHLATSSMPEAGVVIASGGNAGLACAWAAKATSTNATVFLPETAPAFKLAKLEGYGAAVHLVGTEYADALNASIEYARKTGALLSHAYDQPLIAAGAGTLGLEILEQAPETDTIVVAVGGGGLFSGIAAAVSETGVRVVAVEPERSQALHAAIRAGGPVDVVVDSIAADSLGARRVSDSAHAFAVQPNVRSVVVPDHTIREARQWLWDDRRIAVEHGTATALAALRAGAYVPTPGERLVVVLCGANTDPTDLVT